MTSRTSIKHRVISMLTAAAMLVLAACGGGGGSADSSGSSSGSSATIQTKVSVGSGVIHVSIVATTGVCHPTDGLAAKAAGRAT